MKGIAIADTLLLGGILAASRGSFKQTRCRKPGNTREVAAGNDLSQA